MYVIQKRKHGGKGGIPLFPLFSCSFSAWPYADRTAIFNAKKGFLLLFAVFGCLLQAPPVKAEAEIQAYFFYGEGCPHCAKAEPFLKEIEQQHPTLRLHRLETWHNPENARFFVSLSKACGSQVMGVPTLFVGDRVFIGWDEKRIAPKIKEAIEQCERLECSDPALKMTCKEPAYERLLAEDAIVELPFFGKVDTRTIPLPLFTIFVGLLDGFNPCAMWVLTFLLTLIIYARSRRKILLIGAVFVFASGFVYFVFMAAWLNFFLLIGYVDVTRIMISIVAIVFGLINIKDFFFFKKGVSLSIPEKYKPSLYRKMRELLKEQKLPATIAGTAFLATFANVIELLCTAGFPAIYTRVLTLNQLEKAQYYAYLALYNLVYVIPLAVIVAVFAWTMGGRKFSEKEGRILKLIGGVLMAALGIVLLVKPELVFFG